MSLLAGRGDVGKTTIALDLAAQLSRGELAGDLAREGKTLYFSDEASFEHVISPRYAAAGGEPGSLFTMTVDAEETTGPMTTRSLRLDVRDMVELARAVADEGIDLIVIDPIDMLLGGVETYRNNEVRAALGMIQSAGCTVIGIQHHIKGTSKGHAGDQVMGSAAFRNFPRSLLQADRHPDRAEEILVAHNKSNYGSRQPTLSLRIVDSHVPGYGQVEWLGEDQTSADELFQSRRRRTHLKECSIWVQHLLTDNGPMTTTAIKELAKAELGFGRTTVYDALKLAAATKGPDGLWTL